MNVEKKQSLQFTMKPLSFEQMGEKLIRVTCYLLGTGINRNGSNITKESILNANKNLSYLPVVAHIMQDDNGDYYLGGHDYTIEVQPEMEIKPLTIPVGCVVSSSDAPFEFVELVEDSTGEKREYMKVDMILWNHLSPIMQAAYNGDVYFNHSIEIDEVDGRWDSTNNFRIDSFVYDRACLLGLCKHDKRSITHTEPAFEKAQVYPKTYSMEDIDFTKQFTLIVEEIKKFNLESLKSSELNINCTDLANALSESAYGLEAASTSINTLLHNVVNASADIATNYDNNKEVVKLDKTKVFEKIRSVLSELKYRSNTDKHYDKYDVHSITEDGIVNVVDREDGYKVYSIPYLATEAKDDIIVNIDYDKKEQKSFVIGDNADVEFNIKKEIDMISNDYSEYQVSRYDSTTISDLKQNMEILNEDLDKAKSEIIRLTNQLSVFESEKKQLMQQKHKETIDTLINSKREEMGKYSEFLNYCINPDYNKSVEQIANELKEIHYNFLNKNNSGKRSNFSAIETNVLDTNIETDNISKRYGSEIAKYFNK